MLWGSIFIIAGAMIFGDWVIGLLYGAKFLSAPQIFKIHIWSTIPNDELPQACFEMVDIAEKTLKAVTE